MKRWIFAIGLMGLLPGFAAAEDWARATAPRDWQFPRDHGAHPEFKTEWWYVTGHLADSRKNEFGFQVTFFRQGLRKELPPNPSKWSVRDLYFGHFTITDFARKKFRFAERMTRGSLGQAAYADQDLDLRLEDWRMGRDGDAFWVKAAGEGAKLDARLEPLKPIVLQGNRGLSQKGEAAGNASHYYSIPRMKVTGTLELDGQTGPVTGEAWLDREFSTSALDPGICGWDWFSVQLNNGEELMLYELRREDGGRSRQSHAAWIQADGTKRELDPTAFQIEVLAEWTSPAGTRYPAKWRVRLPELLGELMIEPIVADQELRLSSIGDLAYWEGACRVTGTWQGKPIQGRAYVELTGYARSFGQEMRGK